MDLKKKIKGFFTLTRKANSGFTLVELIVVIAILAILGGVAVPAYSGYVKKAERSADEALLNEINTAFASACMANGESNYGRTDVDAEVDANNLFDYTAPYKTEFDSFFEGDNTEFKVMLDIAYNPTLGVFAEGENVTYGSYKLFVSKELADAMKNNNLSAIGAQELMGKVDAVANVAEALFGSTTPNSVINKLIYGSGGYSADLMKAMPYLSEVAEMLNMDPASTEFMQLVCKVENDDPVLNGSIMANSLVLTAARKTEGMDTSFLGTAGSVNTLKSELDNPEKATDAMAKLALTYGMYTAYVKSDAAKPEGFVDTSADILGSNTLTGMADLMNVVESTEFQNYLASDDGKADMDAYLASMQIVNNSVNQSSDAAVDILSNGFTDPNLVAALGGLMSSSAE